METISYKFPLIAQELLEQEKYQEALEVCTEGLKLYPRTLSAYGMSATAIMHLYGSQAAYEFLKSISKDILAKPIYQVFVSNIQQEIENFEIKFESTSFSEEKPTEEPVEEVPEPIAETPEPLEEVPEPVAPTPAPFEEIPEPVAETAESVEETPETFEEVPEPVAPTPAPFEEIPEPVAETAESVEETPETFEEAPEPVEATPEPFEEVPEPIAETPEPVEEITEYIGPLIEKQEQFTTEADLDIATDEDELAHIEDVEGAEIEADLEWDAYDSKPSMLDIMNDLDIEIDNIGPITEKIESPTTEPPELEEEEQDIDEPVQPEPIGTEVEQDVSIPAPVPETDFFIEEAKGLFETFADMNEIEQAEEDDREENIESDDVFVEMAELIENETHTDDSNEEEQEPEPEPAEETLSDTEQDEDVGVLIPPSLIVENDVFDDFSLRESLPDENNAAPEPLPDTASEDVVESEHGEEHVIHGVANEVETMASMVDGETEKDKDIFTMPEQRASRIIDIIPGFKEADVHRWDI